jgi:hypothetical protein
LVAGAGYPERLLRMQVEETGQASAESGPATKAAIPSMGRIPVPGYVVMAAPTARSTSSTWTSCTPRSRSSRPWPRPSTTCPPSRSRAPRHCPRPSVPDARRAPPGREFSNAVPPAPLRRRRHRGSRSTPSGCSPVRPPKVAADFPARLRKAFELHERCPNASQPMRSTALQPNSVRRSSYVRLALTVQGDLAPSQCGRIAGGPSRGCVGGRTTAAGLTASSTCRARVL